MCKQKKEIKNNLIKLIIESKTSDSIFDRPKVAERLADLRDFPRD